jgi:hypothetical protein
MLSSAYNHNGAILDVHYALFVRNEHSSILWPLVGRILPVTFATMNTLCTALVPGLIAGVLRHHGLVDAIVISVASKIICGRPEWHD